MASRKLKIRSSDGVEFEVEEIVALEWQPIKPIIEDGFSADVIPLPNITGTLLSTVIEYCRKHVECSTSEDRSAKDNLKAWDADFIKAFDTTTLLHLLTAANYLNIQSLLDLIFQAVTERIKDKPVEDVRTIFNITNDFTEEEEEEMRKEFPWAFE